MKYLTIDCEMGGIGLQYSLLSSYFGIINKQKELINELDLQLSPDDDMFILSKSGMEVNQIDIRNWDGIPYKQAKSILYDFLAFNSGCEKVKGRWIKGDNFKRLRLIGQDVNGDVASIIKYLISKESWGEFVATIPLDTLYIATFLREEGLLNLKSLSLRSLGEYFGLDINGLHNAKFDAILTFQIYEKLNELIKKEN